MSFGKVSHNIPYILEKTKDNIDFDNYYLPLLGKAPKQIGLTITNRPGVAGDVL